MRSVLATATARSFEDQCSAEGGVQRGSAVRRVPKDSSEEWGRGMLCCALVALCACAPKPAAQLTVDAGASPGSAQLLAVGPRLLSNQTSQPISVWGTGLKPGMT